MPRNLAQISSDIQAIWAAADAEGRPLMAYERRSVEELLAEAKAAKRAGPRLSDLGGVLPELDGSSPGHYGGGIGDAFVRSKGWRELADPDRRPSIGWTTGVVEVPWRSKAGTLLEGGQGAGLTPVPMVAPGIVETLFERPTVSSLMGAAQATEPVVRYIVEGTATNAAAGVAEGAVKPASDLALSTRDEQVTKIATVLSASDEMVEDGRQVQTYLNTRLSHFVSLEEDRQLLHGSGAPELSGIFDRAGLRTYARGTVDQQAVAVFKAANGLRGSAHVEPSAVIVNPTDWQVMRLSTDASEQFYGGGPFGSGPYGSGAAVGSSYPQFRDTIWGLQAMVTSQIGSGTALLGDFRNAARIYRKGGLSVELTNAHEDYFQRDMVMVRAELREALAVFRPDAFVQVVGL